jgi:hypothetical protein
MSANSEGYWPSILGRHATQAAKERLIERHYGEYQQLINEERAARELPSKTLPRRFRDPEEVAEGFVRGVINALGRGGLSLADVDQLSDAELRAVPHIGEVALAWLRSPRHLSPKLREHAARAEQHLSCNV